MNIDKLIQHTDSRGSLVPVDFFSQVPFEPVRLFYITGSKPGTIRGNHGHYKCKQYYICIAGRLIVTMVTKDGSLRRKELCAGDGLFIDCNTWSSQEFVSEGTILLVLASQKYDPKDYFYTLNP